MNLKSVKKRVKNMKKIIIFFFLVMTTMGCSQFTSEKQNDKEFIYLGENETFKNALKTSDIRYNKSQSLKGDSFENIDVLVTDKDYLENSDDGIIQQVLEKNKEVFIMDYTDTKYISKKFFNLDSYDEVQMVSIGTVLLLIILKI
jgi:hypothetical protein